MISWNVNKRILALKAETSAFNANIRLFVFQEIINVGLKKRAQMQQGFLK